MSYFTAYFSSRLETLCPVAKALDSGRLPPSPPTSEEDDRSPTKRPRSDSPETSVASSPSTAPTSYFGSPHHCLSPNAASPSFSTVCQLRGILSPTNTSPPLSRSSSTRSSSACSHTSKQVRFQRCTNASVFPALSGEEYDRTPIQPTCEAESLNLPKRETEGTEGWIKCVERARVAEKERKMLAAAAVAAGESPEPFKLTTTSHKVVEGVHGLVGGGYFVGGEERDVTSLVSSDSEEDGADLGHEEDEEGGDDAMVVDDEEDGGESTDSQQQQHAIPTPSLTHDDSASESDSLPSTSESIPQSPYPVPAPPDQKLVVQVSDSVAQVTVAIEAISAAPAESDVEAAAAIAAELERKRKCKERYGICALGKYTRAEVFQSYDSLGGF